MKNLEVSTVLKAAWEQFKLNIGLSMTLAAIASIPSIFLVLNIDENIDNVGEALTELFIAASIQSFVTGLVYMVAIAAFLETSKKNQTVTLSEALSLLGKHIWHLLLVWIISSFVTVAGLIALIIPGLIIGFLLSFTLFLALEKPELSAIDTLKESSRLVRKDIGAVLLWLVIVIAISFGIGITLLPVSAILGAMNESVRSVFDNFISILQSIYALMGMIFIYRHLSDEKSEKQKEADTKKA